MNRKNVPGATITAALILAALAACTGGDPGVNTQDLSTPAATTTTSTLEPTSSPVSSMSTTETSGAGATGTTESSTVLIPSPTDGLDSQEAADRSAIEDVWRKFWDAYMAINRVAPADRQAVIDPLTGNPLRSQVIEEANGFDVDGLDRYGQVIAHPYWSHPVAGALVATMGDCQDASAAGSVVVNTGEKRTVGVKNNNVRGTFARHPVDGTWIVTEVEYLTDVPCEPSS